LKKNQHILHVLGKCNKKKFRKNILKYCDDDIIKTIAEIAINILNGNNKISPAQKAKLKKHKKQLRFLACAKKSIKAKRKILVQHGGFLPTLIGTILSGVIGKLISKT